MPTEEFSPKLIKYWQQKLSKDRGISVDDKHVIAYLLLVELKQKVFNTRKNWKIIWDYITRKDDMGVLFLLDLSGAIKNAMSFVIFQHEGYTWKNLKREIQRYTLKDDLPLVQEYLKAIDQTLKQ